jgi:hypothetical protein
MIDSEVQIAPGADFHPSRKHGRFGDRAGERAWRSASAALSPPVSYPGRLFRFQDRFPA